MGHFYSASLQIAKMIFPQCLWNAIAYVSQGSLFRLIYNKGEIIFRSYKVEVATLQPPLCNSYIFEI